MFRVLLLLFPLLARAAEIPDGGTNVMPADWQAAAKFQAAKERGTAERVKFDDQRAGWRVAVLDDKANQFQIQLTCVLEGEVKPGDRLLLTFDARCVPGSSTDGKGRAHAVVEIKEPPDYEKLGMDAFDVAPEWRTVFLPFPAKVASKAGLTHASIMPGGKQQTLEIANLRLLNYGAEFDLAKLPRPYIHYPGREADAPWRKAALARIERIRTDDVMVEVVDAQGKPVPDAKVSLTLRRHAFGFGAAVKARLIMDDTKYRAMVDGNFSAIVLENDLKPFAQEYSATNEHAEYRRDWSLGAMSWARERGFRVRGHYLCWGPWEPWSEKLKDQPQAIREKVMTHTDSILELAGGLPDEWDAVNHPVGWEAPRRTVDGAVGSDFYAAVFKAARARTGVPLYINEDQVFRAGRQQEEFYECIKDLIARGGRPDGIGNQAHFHSSFLPAPEEMLRVSDRFAALVPQLSITEFDVDTNGDAQLQADWLRDCLIMAYSHPAYRSFMLWAFWEGAGWKPGLSLWNKDWSAKPNGAAWRDLVCKQWRTTVEGKTNAAGNFAARGHRGLYDVTVEAGGGKVSYAFNTESGAGVLRVVLP